MSSGLVAKDVQPERNVLTYQGPSGAPAFRNRLRPPFRHFADQGRESVTTKLALAVGLSLWITIPYFALPHCVVFPVTLVKETRLDGTIPFAAETAWLYLSWFLFLSIAPLLLVGTREVRRYALGVGLIGLVSHLVFFFYPTTVAWPRGATSYLPFVYRLVVAVDAPLNACPSLHASMGVFSALWCEWLLRKVARPWGWRLALWAWILAILYATLATKQHVLLDLVAGAGLAVAVFAGTACCPNLSSAAFLKVGRILPPSAPG